MAKSNQLTTAQRNKLPSSDFGLPGSRKYPLVNPNKPKSTAQASNAKARAAQQYKVHEENPKKGISKSTEEKIFSRANAVIKKLHNEK